MFILFTDVKLRIIVRISTKLPIKEKKTSFWTIFEMLSVQFKSTNYFVGGKKYRFGGRKNKDCGNFERFTPFES